jgi:hypothetical protein
MHDLMSKRLAGQDLIVKAQVHGFLTWIEMHIFLGSSKALYQNSRIELIRYQSK